MERRENKGSSGAQLQADQRREVRPSDGTELSAVSAVMQRGKLMECWILAGIKRKGEITCKMQEFPSRLMQHRHRRHIAILDLRHVILAAMMLFFYFE